MSKPSPRIVGTLTCAVLLATVGLTGAPGGAGAESGARLASKSVTLKPTKDAYVSSARPDDNFGPSSQLNVGERSTYGATRTVVYFDLGELAKNEVPTEGRLNLYLRDAGPASDPSRDIVLYRLTGDWSESSVTWNHFPDWDHDRKASAGIGTTHGWYHWDVGKFVRNWYSGEWKNRGIYVQGYETAGSYRAFDSREGSNRPELELTVEIDNVPPVAALNPLPPYVNLSTQTLTWPEAIDQPPSSLVDYYQVWMQRNDDPWQLLADNFRELSYTVTGLENGRRYRFCVLAVDRAGNRQPGPQVQTETIADFSPPVTQITALNEWVRGPFDLMWTGTDQPMGSGVYNSGIDHFIVDYNINDTLWGTLVASTMATTYRFAPESGLLYLFRVIAVDRAGNVSAPSEPVARTRADMQAPTVVFAPANGVDSPNFRVSWSGNDGDVGSGVVSYDIQYRIGDSGAWINWAQGTQDTFRDYTGEFGKWYFFRGRAHDLAGNVGAYPSQPQLGVPVIESSALIYHVNLPKISRNS